MKIIHILFFLLLPSLAISQPDGHPTTELSKEAHVHITAHDLVKPVLQRSYRYNHDFLQNNIEYRSQSPAVPFIGSLIIPGSGQIANRNWVKSGLFFAVEAISVYAIFEYRDRGKKGERMYESFANENWSVVEYSKWLVNYHDLHNIDNPFLEEFKESVLGIEATFNTDIDWNAIELDLLRNVERHTPYFTTDDLGASNFSHTLPAYGTQQYYELISKYYQYQAGWRDYHDFHDRIGNTGIFYIERFLVDRNGLHASPFFYDGARMSHRFNQDFRIGNHFLTVLIANHFISAFDAFFTAKIRQNRLRLSSGTSIGSTVKFSYHF